MYRVLIVDDEKMIRMGMKNAIDWKKLGVDDVFTAASGNEALKILKEEGPEIMVTDIQMTEMTGLELIKAARESVPELRVIVLTGFDNFEYARESLRLQVQDFFLKPIDEDDLFNAIEKQIKERFEKYKYENYTEPLSHFRNLVKSVKYYEILNNIELVIHVQASDEVLHDLEEHWTDIKSIGRSEDMVDVQEAKIVELQEKLNKEVNNIYSAYIDYDTIKRGNSEGVRIYPLGRKDKYVRGTVYYLNKNYEISPKNGKRIFQKKKVVYTSNYEINKVGENVYIDEDEYIVNFI